MALKGTVQSAQKGTKEDVMVKTDSTKVIVDTSTDETLATRLTKIPIASLTSAEVLAITNS